MSSKTSSSPKVYSRADLQLSVGDIEYFLIQNEEVNFLQAVPRNKERPVLVLVYGVAPGQSITKAALIDFRSTRLAHDDVFQPIFLGHLVFFGAEKDDVHIEADAQSELHSWGVTIQTFLSGRSAVRVPSGPYVIAEGKTWQPSQAGLDGKIIVPSRCYFNPGSVSRPLDGVRVSVKDSIDIKGHKTTLCNRAWMDLYPAREENATCVQALEDAGAVIVGKVKLQAMIMREEPLECVEFTAPFNPRGDGYQVPSGSSHASAASISSYEWLDLSLGSDTNGSCRKPASYNGCFSIRPSTGILNTKGVVEFFPEFDMPALFGSDISKFPDVISVWYGDSPLLRKPSKFSVKVLYPLEYLPTSNPGQSELLEKLVCGLESAVDTRRTEISLARLWKTDCPDGKEHENIEKYLGTAGIYPFYYDQYHNLADFRTKYEEKHGKPPFVHRSLHWQWDVAKTITRNERDECLPRCKVYRDWLLDKVFEVSSENSISVMVFPIESGQPNYRDAPIPPNSLLGGFNPLHMSPIMRAPEVTAPVGDIPYYSAVTNREERLPIAASIIGAPGTDLILSQLVAKGMKSAGLPTKVKTGRQVF
ncbi:amidase [Karstenula rhodostoma CBS 690.94]|uniref:Amidase n=1 Tax=Karstenula rhodostoma CBS 690.94 TaxID=1392251 RepID=A0A9P4P4Y5_9PLEO|nr:amidase [Karstenula rhodostoma CBS 690.94]